ncbi:hypothetical protein [Spirosoma sp.]|uniref:hypothetical protein n=1 Tax=Spirosoma sp. TaxID=1899569 RepID=UPI002636DC4C|nr:hypothetical protein [Spirosoma sp.]MCX6218358.1 hypothetical protein [Spirosoma sp.]
MPDRDKQTPSPALVEGVDKKAKSGEMIKFRNTITQAESNLPIEDYNRLKDGKLLTNVEVIR